MDRRTFLQGAAAGAATLALSRNAHAEHTSSNPDFTAIQREIEKRHDESVQRLQQWIRQPSIAAEKRGMDEGCDLSMRMLRDAGFGEVTKISTDGQPGIFATLDAGAPRSIGMYFMYDVKQADPAEWSSPPFEAALVDKQDLDGKVTMTLGAKGVIECELVSSGEKWGRGPRKDVHSSTKAMLDSPAWHLVEALVTLVSPDGNTPAIEGFADRARPLSAEEKKMIAEAARRLDENVAKKQLSVEHWVHDVNYEQALELLQSRPTVNIEGLVGGYTGPGGKTILPHRAVAKLDLRLVPDMKADEALAALKAHLAKHGFGDIEVNMTGGYDPNSTSADTPLIRAQVAFYRNKGIDPIILPRSAGSWPGYVFTGDPLHLAAGHFGMGHGSGAHAPDEYYVIESTNPNVQGIDGAVRSHVEYLYELAAIK